MVFARHKNESIFKQVFHTTNFCCCAENAAQRRGCGTLDMMVCSNVSQLEVSGVKLRDVVLRCIQSDFKSMLIFFINF